MAAAGLRWYALVVGIAVVGCKRQGEPAVNAVSGSGSAPGAIAVPVATPPVAPDAMRPALPNAACPPRASAPDPGPTKGDAQARPLGPDVADVKDQCVKHADCSERAHGRCVHQPEHEVYPFGQRRTILAHNECIYDECTSDDECRQTSTNEPKAELVCTCADERNTCTFANCRSDKDCTAPFTCGAWHYCHSAADACGPKKACKQGDECVYSWTEKHYICQDATRTAPD